MSVPDAGLWMRLISRLVDSGVSADATVTEERWVRTINVATPACMVVNTGFAITYLILGFDALLPVIVTNLIWNGFYFAVLVLNARGYPRRAVWTLLLTVWANTLIPAITMGTGTGVYLYLVLVPLVAVLVSSPGDRAMQAVALVFGVAAFTVVPLVFTETPAPLAGSRVESALFAASAFGVAVFGALFALYYRWLVDQAEAALARANDRSERLLLNILPGSIADRLKAEESPIADRVDDVTVLFADLVGSTPLTETMSADAIVALLDELFSEFDDLADHFGIEKITTIGDGYLVASGLPAPRPDHMVAAVEMALAMRDTLNRYQVQPWGPLDMRFGLCSGPVVAGVIGRRKFRYDIWGDTVNTASRMESHSEPGKIHVPEQIYLALRNRYEFESRGVIPVKGKAPMKTYFLLGRKIQQTVSDHREEDLVPA